MSTLGSGLLIRADADEHIGAGHVMRCLAIAQAWSDEGRGPVWLVSSVLPEALRARYEREGFQVRSVRAGRAALARATRESGASWVVLDGYAFGIRDQRVIKGEGARLLVIDDDGAAGSYVAEVVVDPNAFAHDEPYANRPPATRLLLGPRYALLRRELRDVHRAEPKPVPRPRVLVTFGGADPAGLSRVALEALDGADLDVTLVLGPANARSAEVSRAAESSHNVAVVCDAPNMHALMDAADLAVVASGGTCLELAHLGVPQVVVATAPNQKRVAEALAQRGVARTLGDAAGVTASALRAAVLSLAHDAVARREMRARGMALVDGRGATRVVEAMAEAVSPR